MKRLRRGIFRLMAWRTRKEAVPSLISSLKYEKKLLREFSAFALGSIGPPAYEAIAALTEALEDENKHVRDAASYALVRIGPSNVEAAPPLTKAQKDEEKRLYESKIKISSAVQRIELDAYGYGMTAMVVWAFFSPLAFVFLSVILSLIGQSVLRFDPFSESYIGFVAVPMVLIWVGGGFFWAVWLPRYIRRRKGITCDHCGYLLRGFAGRSINWQELNALNDGRCPKCDASLLSDPPTPIIAAESTPPPVK